MTSRANAAQHQLQAVPKGMNDCPMPGGLAYMDTHKGDQAILEDSVSLLPGGNSNHAAGVTPMCPGCTDKDGLLNLGSILCLSAHIKLWAFT